MDVSLIPDVGDEARLAVQHAVGDDLLSPVRKQDRVLAIRVVSGAGLLLPKVVAAVVVPHLPAELVVGGKLKFGDTV